MSRQWTLPTASGQYVVSLLPDSSGLVLDHWGATIDDGVEPWSEPDRRDQYRLPADAAPLEFATAGQRHVGFSELLIDRGDSLTGAAWHCSDPDGSSVEVIRADGRTALAVSFEDERGELRLTLRVATDDLHDVVRRSIRLDNISDARTVTLPRAFSAGWALPVGQTATVRYLAGRWAEEFTPKSIDLDWGTFSIGSRAGVTGLAFSPVVSIASRLQGRENEAYGVALAWSGSWRLQAEATSSGDRVRVSCGLDDDTTTITLLPGETFDSPESLGTWSASGVEGVTQAWHTYQRSTLARSLDPYFRPIVYNSWFATEFDVRIEHQLQLAEIARQLDVEIFVVDDGWFAGRNDDTAGLGDWRPDPVKFPDGLRPLADQVIARGMRFGLWIEPEAVNADSDLFREHPNWVYRAEGRPLVTVRNQYVLDLGRDEVVEWVEQTFREVLSSAPITYIKWDMNRPVSDGGRPGDPHGRQWSLQHTAGYYRVLRTIREEFPHVVMETCGAGGGRVDNGSLALSDVFWPSDETGPRDRLAIQHGYLSAYPAYAMSSWITDDPGLRDRSAVSFEFRFVVAMAGALGVGADLLGWTPDQVKRAAELIALYRELRPVIHTGTVRRHGLPSDDTYAVEYASPADGSGRLVVLVYDHNRDRTRDRERVRVRPAGLVPTTRYSLRGTDLVVSGQSAATLGVVVPFALAVDADILVFDPVT